MKAVRKLVGVASHHEWEVQELREDREFAIEYAKVAIEGLNNPEERGGSLLSLGAVAAQAGISRESLYRALSPKGNPTLKTLIAVLKTLGLRLTVTPHQDAKQTKTTDDCAA